MKAMALNMDVPGNIWELSSSVIGMDGRPANLSHTLVLSVELALLRSDWPEGRSLGGLWQVREALGLGRPACQEAITILQARGVLDVRRGRSGGIFVGAPSLEDTAAATLLYLTASGATQDCILQFRLSVWRMIVEAAVRHGARLPDHAVTPGEGFASRLARSIGNPAMVVAASLAELLARVSDGPPATAHDAPLDTALAARDLGRALRRLEDLSGPAATTTPIIALDEIEQRLSSLSRNLALTLAARMLRELSCGPQRVEAEWETAERLGYTPATVRQARRVLQDMGLVRCRQGRRGMIRSAPANPGSVIRLLAPCLVASGMTANDNREAAYYLACSAPALAARRETQSGAIPITRSAPSPGADVSGLLRFENFLLDQCGNPLIGIMVRSLGLAGVSTAAFPARAWNGSDVTVLNDRILQAIENGDPDAADGLARAKASAMPQIADGSPGTAAADRPMVN